MTTTIDIKGGRIYLEIDGVRQESYYNQVYTAQAAAINLSIQTGKDVTIVMPDQVVSADSVACVVPPEPEPEPESEPVVESLRYYGDWQSDDISRFSADPDAYVEVDLEVDVSALYTLQAYLEYTNNASPHGYYSIQGIDSQKEQRQRSGWFDVVEVYLDKGTTTLTLSKNASGSAPLRFSDVRLTEVVQTKQVRVSWQQAKDTDGELITPIEYQIELTNTVGDVQTVTQSGKELSTTLDLALGTYSVVIRAVNNAGVGDWSEAKLLHVE